MARTTHGDTLSHGSARDGKVGAASGNTKGDRQGDFNCVQYIQVLPSDAAIGNELAGSLYFATLHRYARRSAAPIMMLGTQLINEDGDALSTINCDTNGNTLRLGVGPPLGAVPVDDAGPPLCAKLGLAL